MGRVKNATLPYTLSLIVVCLLSYAFYHIYECCQSSFEFFSNSSEVILGVIYVLTMWKLIPVLFFRTSLFIPFYNIAMYPPKRSNISKREWANEMMQRKRRGKLPFASKFPNGWFAVAISSELKRGMVKPVNILDKNLAVFRGQKDGVAYVVDGYCPHLGANMSVLGTVVNDNCLQCPFHGWTFRGEDGVCVDIPYCSSSNTTYPKQARVKSYIVEEKNGVVFMWHHNEDREPDWFVEPVENYSDYYEAGHITHTINCHISEIPENGADFAHFFMLHEDSMLAGGDMEVTKSSLGKVMTHKWTPKNWTVGSGSEKHIIKFDLHLQTYFGTSNLRVPGFDEMKAEVVQYGPAYVSLKINMGCLLQGYFIQTIMPEEQFLQRVTHRLIAKPFNPLLLTKMYLQSERYQFERDVSMWNHKIYQSNPVLVKDDGPIRKYRNWYQQFYSTQSAAGDSEHEQLDHNQNSTVDNFESEKIASGNELKQRKVSANGNANNLDW